MSGITNAFVINNVRQRRKLNTNIYMTSGQVPYVPYFPNKASKDYQWMDIYNALGRDRTLFVGRYLDDESCNQLIASLIWLQGQSETNPVTLYFNVPGANSKPSLAVFDVMRRMKCPLITINAGLTVGMGALLCAVGSPGQRFAFPNSRFLMSKSGLEDGTEGQAAHIHLQVAEVNIYCKLHPTLLFKISNCAVFTHVLQVMKDNIKATKEFARLCGQPLVKLEADLKRDFYLTAAEAAAYGVVDRVLMPAQVYVYIYTLAQVFLFSYCTRSLTILPFCAKCTCENAVFYSAG